MTDPTLIQKYLAGEANDSEIQQCEKLLSDPSFLESYEGDLGALPLGDSLVETLRSLGAQTSRFEAEDSGQDSLVEQIQSFVSNRKIEHHDLDRILDPAESEDELGRIAHYRVIEFIAGGGMGLVFKAEDSKLQRLVCVKVLNPSLANIGDSKARFMREAKSAARLRNSRIVTVLEFGEHRGLPYLVMELLEGSSLREKLNVDGRLDATATQKLVLQIAEGLRYAHRLGFLHRDIKPENIWVTPEGDAKLLDFGLARSIDESTQLTHSGTILGTPTYMSPEQVQGKELNERSDLFSVGTVMFEMLTGESPFGKSNVFSTMMSVANDTLAFPEMGAANAIPGSFETIVRSLLQKNPDDRMSSADQLIEELIHQDMTDLPASTRQKRGLSSGIVGVLSGLAGAALLALTFCLFQLNDKGTLVVEADPSVNVSIANETVSVEDPETNEKFRVSIGDHPLPSGVYQLEMIGASGKYTLSSDVIVIRRGEKQIVRVQLKPADSEQLASSVATETENAPETNAKPRLSTLPTLGPGELRRKLNVSTGQPLFRNAVVTEPGSRPGVVSWAIEPAFTPSNQQKLNIDGTRIAATSFYEGYKVSIWNRKGQVTHLIPSQSKIKQVQWSPDPDIFAVVENGKERKQIVVWKLFRNYAEVINVVPADGSRASWSPDGLLLAIETEREVSFVDLAKGGVYAHPNFGIRGQISDRPWSHDGRYFASSIDSDVHVWDLEQRKLFHIFNRKQEAQFLKNKNLIALKAGRKWEVWDLESFLRTEVIESSADWVNYWPDPSFERLAAVNKTGGLVLQNVSTGTETSTKLPIDSRYNTDEKRLMAYRSTKFEWSENGQFFGCNLGTSRPYVTNTRKSRDGSISTSVSLASIPPLMRQFVDVGSSRHNSLRDYSKASGKISFFNRTDFEKDIGTIAGFDLGTMRHLPATEFSISDTDSVSRISPNGKLIAVVGSDIVAENGVLPESWSAEMQKVRVCSLETGKLIKTLDTGAVHELLWAPDSSSLIVSTIRSKEIAWSLEREVAGFFGQMARRTIEKHDANGDGKLSVAEAAKPRKPPGVDENDDGEISVEEIVEKIFSGTRKKEPEKFAELETIVFSLHGDRDVKLKLDPPPESSNPSELCFQREPIGRRGWNFAKPLIWQNQIVIPLFEATAFRNGNRIPTDNSRAGEIKPNKDKLGFFDITSGKLTKLIELNCRIDGKKLSVTDDWILAGYVGERGNLNTFVVFDRNNGNRPMLPGRNAPEELFKDARLKRKWDDSFIRVAPKGNTFLSPKHPFVALVSKGLIEVWELDAKNSSLTKVQAISRSKDYPDSRSVVWHPTAPIFGWIADSKPQWYNVATKQRYSDTTLPFICDMWPTTDGWIAIGSGGIISFDLNQEVSKTYLATGRFAGYENPGRFDQCITASGEILNPAAKSNLRAVQLIENRIETLTMADFESQVERSE